MPRHSFIRMTKLTDIQGRIDYISNPKRQEHLYATYSTVAKPEFWQRLSEQSQYDFWRSNQKTGKCIEGRELIIALPEELQSKDPELLLKLFTETMRTYYGVHCSAALHHNKAMTNYHIHLVFADREVVDKTEMKYATRNMFYNEERRHVRTKKEILDENGNIRPGCRIIGKGDLYEIKWFSGRKDIFKKKSFLTEIKARYTDLINQCVDRNEDMLEVFDDAGPYLPTKKIGKHNPREADIRHDNELRKEWNQTVDQVLIAGGSHEEVTEFKREEVVDKVATSVKDNGYAPGLFADLLIKAIAVLKRFLDMLMNEYESEQVKGEESIDVNFDLSDKNKMEPRPDSHLAEMNFLKIKPIHEKLTKCNRKLYALQKKKQTLQKALDGMKKSFFNRKDRKALSESIEGLERQIELTRNQMEAIPKLSGYNSVQEAENVYRTAKKELDDIKRAQAEWDGVTIPENKEQTEGKKTSVLKQLAEKQRLVNDQKKEQLHFNFKRSTVDMIEL